MRRWFGGLGAALLCAGAGVLGCDDDPQAAADAAAVDAEQRDARAADARSRDGAPADARAEDAALADARAEDAAPLDAARGDAARGDAAPADAAPGDAAPLDAATVDAAPVDAAPVDAARGDAARLDAMPGDAAHADAVPVDAAPPPVACPVPRSACQADGDCGGGDCRAVPEAVGATCFCVEPRTFPRRQCDGGGLPEGCCDDADCPVDPQGRASWCIDFQVDYCGGAAPPDINTCRVDACLSDADCGPDLACVPAGAFGLFHNRCVAARCARDADCALRAGGECRPYIARCSVEGFFCSYADDPCRVDRDCPPDEEHGWPQRCAPRRDGTGADCVPDLPAP